MKPTKCTRERVAKICKALSSGVPLPLAAEYAGTARSTIYDWIRKGSADGAVEPFKSAAADIAQADGEGTLRLFAIVRKAAETDPKLALTLLERRAPQHFARRDNVEMKIDQTVRGGGVVIMTPDPPARDDDGDATDAPEDETDDNETTGVVGVVLLPPKELDS
jgi:hypothetical protein